MSSSLDICAGGQCDHCANPIPKGALVSSPAGSFCCQGCRLVRENLAANGLEGFYQFRDRPLEPVSGRLARPAKFGYLDEAQFRRSKLEDQNGNASARFFIEGARCQACLWVLEKIPEILPSVLSARFSLSNSIFEVHVSPEGSLAEVARLIQSYGYRPHLVFEDVKAKELKRKEKRLELVRVGVAFAAAGNIMLLSAGVYAGAQGRIKEWFDWASLLIALPSVTYCALPFYRSSWGALKNKGFSIDISVSLGIVLGYAASAWNVWKGAGDVYFDTIAMLVFLLLGSRHLLNAAREKGLDASAAKNFFSNAAAKRVEPDGRVREVHASLLKAGDLIELGPGETAPVDAVAEMGESYFNESVITGESFPVKKRPGDRIFGGSENQTAIMRLRADSSLDESKMGKILSRLQSNWGKQTRMARLSDRFSKNLVAAASFLALSVFLWFWSQGAPQTGFQRALALVIITCPCALGFNIPIAMMMGMKKFAKQGIMLKDDAVVEKIGGIKNVFLDKTGTITSGRRQASLKWAANPEPEALYALESRSRHPLAASVTETLESEFGQAPLGALEVEEYREIPGRGPAGKINGSLYEIRPASGAQTSFELLKDGSPILEASVEDALSERFAFAARELKNMGKTVFLLSGDSKERVQAAERAGAKAIEKSYWGVDPVEKEKIVSRTPRSLMLGDGVNDALALKGADVGAAANGGVDLALSSSEVYFCSGGPEKLIKLFKGADILLDIVKANVYLAVAYNLVFILLALAGKIGPLAAAILMPASSLTLLGASLALLAGMERVLSK